MYCLQSRPYIFQPGNFTGLGSEGVKPHRVRRGKRRDRGEISALIKLPKAVGGCRNYTLFCRLFLTSFVFGFVCLFVVLFCLFVCLFVVLFCLFVFCFCLVCVCMCTVVVFWGVFPLLVKSSFGDRKYGFVNNNKGSGGGGGFFST